MMERTFDSNTQQKHTACASYGATAPASSHLELACRQLHAVNGSEFLKIKNVKCKKEERALLIINFAFLIFNLAF